jgi:hypothetical protein
MTRQTGCFTFPDFPSRNRKMISLIDSRKSSNQQGGRARSIQRL